VYEKFSLVDPPGPDCSLSPDRLAEFFAEMLQLYDSGSEANKGLPHSIRMLLNRHYNNTYVHLRNTFPGGEIIERVHSLCRLRSIGDAFRNSNK
jgi:hypothetical protein